MLRDTIIDRLRTVDGITYSYDPIRSKWLSVGKYHISYGINHRNIDTSRWLAVTHGIYSNNVGFKISENGTIVKVTFQSKNLTTCKFMIVKEIGDTATLTLELDNEAYKLFDTDVDFDQGDSLRCYIEITDGNKVDYPFIVLEWASKTD